MKRSFILLSVIVLLFSYFSVFTASAFYNDNVHTESERFYLINLDTGAVLFDKNSTERCAPASLTKIMTAIVALERCEDLETPITLSQAAYDELLGTGSSLSGLKAGETLPFKDMLACMMIPSGNDAAMAIAEFIGGGSIPAFVDMMNEKAKELGCNDTHFVNVQGLDDDGHYTSAKDVAVMAQHALGFSIFGDIVSKKSYELPASNLQDARTVETSNLMMNEGIKEYYLDGITGLKTGTTTNAGRCICCTATRNGYTYMAVVMGGPFYDYDEDGVNENFAFMDARAMMNWCFDNIRLKVVAEHTQIAAVSDVKYASSVDHLRLVPAEDYTALVIKNADPASVLIEPSEELPKSLRAPIRKGEYICKGRVLYADQEIASIDLVAAENVRFNLFVFIWTVLKTIFKSAVFKLLLAAFLIFVAVFIGLTIRKNMYRKQSKNRIRPVK